MNRQKTKTTSESTRPTPDQIKAIVSALVSLLVIALPVHSQLIRGVVAGGGSTTSSLEYVVQVTLAQGTIGRIPDSSTPARIGFWYLKQRSREVDTSSVTLALPSIDAETGQMIDVHVLQRNGSWPGGDVPQRATATIAFNGSVLQPVLPIGTCPPSGECTIEVPLSPADRSGPIGSVRFQVKLGDAVASPLHIQSVEWDRDRAYRLVTESGIVNVTDVCVNGDSVRLVIAGERTVLRPPTPNPASATIRLSFNLVATTRAVVRLVSVEGATVWSAGEQEMAYGEHELVVDVGTVGQGRYFVVLETEDGIYYQPLMVLR